MNKKHVLLTGMPGIGKTTLTRKICEELAKKNVKTEGFYTEELRNQMHSRVGFDVVDLNGNRGRLARSTATGSSKYAVGKYSVFPEEFERVSLPIFARDAEVLVIDEIGKMELFSNKFKIAVEGAFEKQKILATIPVKRGGGIPFVEKLRHSQSSHVVTVTEENRDKLLPEILKQLEC